MGKRPRLGPMSQELVLCVWADILLGCPHHENISLSQVDVTLQKLKSGSLSVLCVSPWQVVPRETGGPWGVGSRCWVWGDVVLGGSPGCWAAPWFWGGQAPKVWQKWLAWQLCTSCKCVPGCVSTGKTSLIEKQTNKKAQPLAGINLSEFWDEQETNASVNPPRRKSCADLFSCFAHPFCLLLLLKSQHLAPCAPCHVSMGVPGWDLSWSMCESVLPDPSHCFCLHAVRPGLVVHTQPGGPCVQRPFFFTLTPCTLWSYAS